MQAITGKRETWRSLRTKDPQQAKVYALTYALETEKAKLTVASKKDNLTDLLQQTTKPLTITTPDGHKMEFDISKPAEKAFAKDTVKDLMAQFPAYRAPEPQVWSNEEQQRMRDDHVAFKRLEREAQDYRDQLLAQKAKKTASPKFIEFSQAYVTLKGKTAIKDRTKKRYVSALKVWENFIGKSATLDDITPQTVLNFQTWLAKDDPKTERKGITARSIDGYTQVISNVYKTTIKKQADNPVEGQLVKKKERMKSNRKPFTPNELSRIFDPVRLNEPNINPTDLFVPVLGLLTGSRPASICQLRLGDIRREDGIQVICYHDYLEENSSKSSASNRITPLHPLLEKIGFLRYLDDVYGLPDTNATTLIFPWLNLYEQGYADVPSQRFTAVLKTLGIYLQNVKVFYSLRHNTNQRMKERGVPEDFRSQYIGHENDSVNHRTYGEGTTPPKFLLQSVIPHLQFDEVNWDAIQYQSQPDHLLRLYQMAQKRDRIKAAKINDKNRD